MRGLPIDGSMMNTLSSKEPIFATGRDIGNFSAGYETGKYGVPWWLTRRVFDMYNAESKPNGQKKEKLNSTIPQKNGWEYGKQKSIKNQIILGP